MGKLVTQFIIGIICASFVAYSWYLAGHRLGYEKGLSEIDYENITDEQVDRIVDEHWFWTTGCPVQYLFDDPNATHDSCTHSIQRTGRGKGEIYYYFLRD
jgi:hypothetical protein